MMCEITKKSNLPDSEKVINKIQTLKTACALMDFRKQQRRVKHIMMDVAKSHFANHFLHKQEALFYLCEVPKH